LNTSSLRSIRSTLAPEQQIVEAFPWDSAPILDPTRSAASDEILAPNGWKPAAGIR